MLIYPPDTRCKLQNCFPASLNKTLYIFYELCMELNLRLLKDAKSKKYTRRIGEIWQQKRLRSGIVNYGIYGFGVISPKSVI